MRFGHRVKAGALCVVGLPDGARIELFCGDPQELGRVYRDYEVFGTRGMLWRTDDGHEPNRFIAAGQPADNAAGWEGGAFRPCPDGARDARGSMRESY